MLRHHPTRALVGALVLVVALGACRFSGFGDAPSQSTAAAAVGWLETRQQSDGGFEVAGFAGFETPDAVAAIATDAQTTYFWNATTARNAVLATVENGNTPLSALDDFADGPIGAGEAAKLIALVTAPLGLSSTSFDPDRDGAKNLVATLDAGLQPNGSYGFFNETLFGAIAKRASGSLPPASTIALVRNAQHANGGWNFLGTTSGTAPEIDTTALAIQALVAGGAGANDLDVRQGLFFLAALQRPNGAWQAFGADDPNSTSSAVLAVTAAGYDVNVACWRNTAAPPLAGNPYGNPIAWLRSRQAADGHIVSPNDAFPPVNTFATSQTVQALERSWLPVAPIAPRGC
jgi:hypothetical protein